MVEIYRALIPVFLLIALGYGIRRSGFLGDEFWTPAEKSVYFLFFPALLVKNLATAELGDLNVLSYGGAQITAMLILAAAVLSMRPFWREGPAAASALQGSIRFNTNVGLAAAHALYGEAGLVLAAVSTAILVPFVNLLAVSGHLRLVQSKSLVSLDLLKGLARNPLILACALGLSLNGSGLGLPFGIEPFLSILSQPALPLGLIAVGAGFHFSSLRDAGSRTVMASLLKLLTLPMVTLVCLWAFDVHGITAEMALLWAALPTAATSYVLSKQMGGDAPIMAAIITLTTTLSFITLPIVLTLLS